MVENTVNTTPESNGATQQDTPVVTQDSGLDVTSLLKASKEVPEKKETALERMQREKNEHGVGLVVDTKTLEENSKEKQLITNKAEHDAMNEVDAYLAEQDQLIAAAQNMKFDRAPQNAQELVSVMNVVESASKDADVTSGKKVVDMNVHTNETEEKTAEEAAAEAAEEAKQKEEMSEEKKNLVNILIDKTGLGSDFHFTEEEQEKLRTSTEIRVREVEEVDLASIEVEASDKSFLESVEEFQISDSKCPVVFPASRFKAYMTGLSYGEMGDLTLNTENPSFDQLHKRLTVIYNKMVNPSIGKFKDFNDFLHNFAYTDVDLAVYGLVVASFPEIDEIDLQCNNAGCKKGFKAKYSPRTLIKFNKANEHLLKAMEEVVNCPVTQANELLKKSPTQTHKRVRLPMSKFVLEIGIASAYDYLYNIVDNVINDKFKETHPDDVNGILQLNSTLLGMIRTVYVPTASGKYRKYDQFEDMINALYRIEPEEIAVLIRLLQEYNDKYSIGFEINDVVCPHCGTKTSVVPIDPNTLVFHRQQYLMTMNVDISNISVL